jgi:hypothetical protein
MNLMWWRLKLALHVALRICRGDYVSVAHTEEWVVDGWIHRKVVALGIKWPHK